MERYLVNFSYLEFSSVEPVIFLWCQITTILLYSRLNVFCFHHCQETDLFSPLLRSLHDENIFSEYLYSLLEGRKGIKGCHPLSPSWYLPCDSFCPAWIIYQSDKRSSRSVFRDYNTIFVFFSLFIILFYLLSIRRLFFKCPVN